MTARYFRVRLGRDPFVQVVFVLIPDIQTREYGYGLARSTSSDGQNKKVADSLVRHNYLEIANSDTNFLGRFVIDHKSVSRKHLTLSVSSVKPGEGVRCHQP